MRKVYAVEFINKSDRQTKLQLYGNGMLLSKYDKHFDVRLLFEQFYSFT